MALGQRIRPPSFDLNVEPLDTLDIDERPPPIMKLAIAQHHALHFFFTDNPIEFTLTYVMKLHAVSEKLKNKYVVNLKWLIWNGLVIPFSSPCIFHERNLHICKDIF